MSHWMWYLELWSIFLLLKRSICFFKFQSLELISLHFFICIPTYHFSNTLSDKAKNIVVWNLLSKNRFCFVWKEVENLEIKIEEEGGRKEGARDCGLWCPKPLCLLTSSPFFCKLRSCFHSTLKHFVGWWKMQWNSYFVFFLLAVCLNLVVL